MNLNLDAFERALDGVGRLDSERTRAEVAAVLEANGGALTRNQALVLCERTGWSVRSLYRFAADVRSGRAQPTGTFVERIAKHGGGAFIFDDLALTMYYLLGGNMRRFRQEVVDAGFEMPSLSTLSRALGALDPSVREGARHGQRGQYGRLFYIRHNATYVDEAWQLDAFSLDLRTLVPATGEDDADGLVKANGKRWRKCRPQLLVLVDTCSRFVTGWALLDHEPTAADTCCLFADAFETRPADDGTGVAIGGLCDRLVTDNANSFRSHLVEGMLAGFNTSFAPAPAYVPTAKGKVERVGQTLQAKVVTGLAGVVSGAQRRNLTEALGVDAKHWLTFERVKGIVADAVHDYNYVDGHSALGGRTPFGVYAEERAKPPKKAKGEATARRVVPDELLAEHYLPIAHNDGRRKVQPSGVFAFGTYWLGAGLDPAIIGTEVEVRSLHHRRHRLALFSVPAKNGRGGGRYLGMVRPSTKLTDDERRAIVGDRFAATGAVSRYGRKARQALRTYTAGVAVDDGTTLLDAVLATNISDGSTDPEPASDDKPQQPARTKTRNGKARPPSRPPHQYNKTDHLPGSSGPALGYLDDREAILDGDQPPRRPGSSPDKRRK